MRSRDSQDEFDRLKLLLMPVMRAIAVTIGPKCEVVLHDLRRLAAEGSTIVWIENGHVTGRSVGGPTTNLGLEALRSGEGNPDRYDYRSLLPDGRVLRSSSVYFRGTDRKLLAALCINVDISELARARETLDMMVGTMPLRSESQPPGEEEIFGSTIDEVIDGVIASAAAGINNGSGQLTRSERLDLVRVLDEKGAFQIKKLVGKLSGVLGVSRATIYADLDEIRNTNDADLSSRLPDHGGLTRAAPAPRSTSAEELTTYMGETGAGLS